MPFYQYDCPDCEVIWDEFRHVSDRNSVCCSHCGKKAERFVVATGVGFAKDSKIRDGKGTPIWFPNDERPYFDRALGKTFYTKKQKAEYMKDKGLCMDGSDTKTRNLDVAAGDVRDKNFRKHARMED